MYDGWGYMNDGFGIRFEDNKIVGTFATLSPYGDPKGKIDIRENEMNPTLPNYGSPERTTEFVDKILSQELRAADLIKMVRETK